MRILKVNGKTIVVYNDAKKIETISDIIDLMVRAKSECNSNLIALDLNTLTDIFFNADHIFLNEFLQKIKFYLVKIAIYGDLTRFSIKDAKDFISKNKFENSLFFVETKPEAIKLLQEV